MQEIEVAQEDVRVGDTVLAFRWEDTALKWITIDGVWKWNRVTPQTVHVVDANGIGINKDVERWGYWHTFSSGRVTVRVRREVAQQPAFGTSSPHAPASRIPDWPLQCTRCGRPESAVLLFSSYDCRHGCFRR